MSHVTFSKSRLQSHRQLIRHAYHTATLCARIWGELNSVLLVTHSQSVGTVSAFIPVNCLTYLSERLPRPADRRRRNRRAGLCTPRRSGPHWSPPSPPAGLQSDARHVHRQTDRQIRRTPVTVKEVSGVGRRKLTSFAHIHIFSTHLLNWVSFQSFRGMYRLSFHFAKTKQKFPWES